MKVKAELQSKQVHMWVRVLSEQSIWPWVLQISSMGSRGVRWHTSCQVWLYLSFPKCSCFVILCNEIFACSVIPTFTELFPMAFGKWLYMYALYKQTATVNTWGKESAVLIVLMSRPCKRKTLFLGRRRNLFCILNFLFLHVMFWMELQWLILHCSNGSNNNIVRLKLC